MESFRNATLCSEKAKLCDVNAGNIILGIRIQYFILNNSVIPGLDSTGIKSKCEA